MRIVALPLVVCLLANAAPAPWVVRSNENARMALAPTVRFSPEGAASLGIEGHDEGIADMGPNLYERQQEAARGVLAELKKRRAAEKDPLVAQDLDIMIRATEEGIHSAELNRKYRLPYINVVQMVFGSMRSLLDDQVAEKRRPAALVRLRKYTGLEKGFEPVTALAERRTRERLDVAGLIGPPKDQVEKDLANAPLMLEGIGQLFAKYKIDGYQEPLAKLKEQVAGYSDFIRKEILPRARTDFRLPPELYADNLKNYGVDIPPTELAAIAHKAFSELQAQANTVARKVAKEKGIQAKDYREVIRALKKDQLTEGQILDHYKTRIAQIEDIVRREKLVTLPSRPARMRVATKAESASQPAPHMRPPRLLGNTGESGEFVLTTSNPNAAPGAQMDDFTFAAASWTLTCHEARPGHEMQFSKMVEAGVSDARAIFAFNSTNVEGWGLYSEWVLFPYMPAEGQLISLQHRMMRAARAFIDPELQAGKLTPAEAKRILMEDVVLSDPMATQEVDRYTYRAPGQATSYFYGYTRLLDIRQEAEKKLGAKFNAQSFHDFILSQGLLPPALLKKAVMEQYAR